MSRRQKQGSIPVPPELARFVATLRVPTKTEMKNAADADAKASKAIIRAIAIRDGYIRPPWMGQDPAGDADGPKIRQIKNMMKPEWRTMSTAAVWREIEEEAKKRNLPRRQTPNGPQFTSRRSVDRALGRDKKPGK
jgi:hypothetical protein